MPKSKKGSPYFFRNGLGRKNVFAEPVISAENKGWAAVPGLYFALPWLLLNSLFGVKKMDERIKILSGGSELLDRIAPLWVELNKYHMEKSIHFSEDFKLWQ